MEEIKNNFLSGLKDVFGQYCSITNGTYTKKLSLRYKKYLKLNIDW